MKKLPMRRILTVEERELLLREQRELAQRKALENMLRKWKPAAGSKPN